MTLLVDQDLALNALEALSPQTPDPVVTKGTERLPVEPLGLEDVAIHLVHLAPSTRTSPVNAPVLAVAKLTGALREPRENVDRELRVLVDLVQADGLVQLYLALDDAGVPLLIHPFHSQILD